MIELLLVVLQQWRGHKLHVRVLPLPNGAAAEKGPSGGVTGEELLRSGIGRGHRRNSGRGRAQALHALEIEAVLLEMAGDVLACEAFHAHELHYGFGDGVFDAEVGDRVDETLVELRRPNQARPLQGAGVLIAAAAGDGFGREGSV